MRPARTVADVGERGVVELLARRFPPDANAIGIGDDAAVFETPGTRLVFTTDAIVEGVDFDLAYASGADIGWKAVAINVSDVAAMGAEPTHAVVTMFLPPTTHLDLVEGVAEGVAEAGDEWSVRVAGGDLSSAPVVELSVALLGTVSRPVLRSGAAVGDAICVTGSLGGSAGGLALLREDPRARGPLVRRHLRPRARLPEGLVLRELGVSAMLDVSDGLAIDLDRLLEAGDKGCEVDPAAIPVDAALGDAAERGLHSALFGGEDYELLFTIEASRTDEARRSLAELGTQMSEIGVVTEAMRRVGTDDLGELKEEAWDHLRNR